MSLNHPFYLKSKRDQTRIQLQIGGAAFLINLLLAVLCVWGGLYLLPFICITVTLSVIAPFFDVPSMVKSGKLTYHSPLFLAEKEKSGVIIIHGGTLLDYVFTLDQKLTGQQRTNLILANYIEGLLHLIQTYENKDLKVRGTSYILNERTADRIGLQKSRTNFLQTLILLLNYVNLTLSYSIARAKLSFPKLQNINTFEGPLKDVEAKKDYLVALKQRLQHSQAN